MRANAPEKIYLTQLMLFATPTISSSDNDIEYIRKDAFIEKACDAYCKICGHYHHTTPNHICRQACDYYNDFRKYMVGE